MPQVRKHTQSFLRHARLVAVLLAGAAATPAAQGPKAGVFRHTDHVRTSWLEVGDVGREYGRDCRGCHDYASDDPARWPKPAELCDRCHTDQRARLEGSPRVDPRAEVRGDEPGRERFQHHEHWRLACSDCHLPRAPSEKAATGVPAAMPMPELGSAAACGTCHGERGKAAGERARFDDGIDRRLARRGESFGAFRHDQHIRREELARQDPSVCLTCHFEVKEADETTLGDKQFSLAGCKDCHAGGRFVSETFEKPSRTGATFLHRLHLGASSDPELKQKGCFACHVYREEERTFDLGSRFQSEDAHDGCVTCHTAWRVRDHGDDERCRRCHDLGGESGDGFVSMAGMATNRPKVALPRALPAVFRFGPQAHDFITGAPDEDCGACHRARLSELPSRLSERRFRHDTHLTARTDDDRTECDRCHRDMARAHEPSDIVLPGAEKGHALYELGSCKECHHAPELAPVVEHEPGMRMLQRFSHSDHLNERHPRRGDALVCVDCHVSKGERVELVPGVAGCTECHGHRDERAATTSGYTSAMVDACLACHLRGVPARREPVSVERLRLARVEGVRTHPRGGDCGACHDPAPLPPLTRSDADRLTLSVEAVTPHAGRSTDKYFEKATIAGRGVLCVDCHWGSLGAWANETSILERQPWYRENRSETRWRRAYGDLLDGGFPGIARGGGR